MQGFEPVTFYQANPDHLDTDPPDKNYLEHPIRKFMNNASNDVIQELGRHIVREHLCVFL